jgi:hypothetical protein
MDEQHTPARALSGGTKISRRTVARGVAWSAPIAAVAYAAPAFAASPPPVIVTPCGSACKHPGIGQNKKTYHFTFCFQTNQVLVGATVTLDSMTIEGGGASENKPVTPTSVTLAPGGATCIYVDAVEFNDSQNGQATLFFHYALASAPGTQVNGQVSTSINSLPPCGTGADPGNNPKLWPHAPTGDADHTPANCVA